MIRIIHIARLAPIGLVAAALAAPGAQAATKVVHPDDRAHRAAPASMTVVAPVTPDNRANRAGPAAMPVVIVRAAAAGGFDWTDAGIGAAAMLGLGLSGAGIAVAIRRPKPESLRV